MEALLSFLFYCLLTGAALYIVWVCLFKRFRRYQEAQISKFTELNQEEVDLENGEGGLLNMSDEEIDLDSQEIEDKI
jgi:hypothetical protein|tara:strand:+ start:278 stop:508 length:231 start_codon:yes stop_codon:yes gene_type:complete